MKTINELRVQRFNSKVIQAMEETNQILEEYAKGTRTYESFTSAFDLIQEILSEDEEDLF